MNGVKNLGAPIGHFLNHAPRRKPPAAGGGDAILQDFVGNIHYYPDTKLNLLTMSKEAEIPGRHEG